MIAQVLLAVLLAAVYPTPGPPPGAPGASDHASHAQWAPAPCVTCHAGIERSVRPAESNPVDAGACARCHSATFTFAGRGPTPPAALKFGHQPHLARGVPCERCHTAGAPSATPVGHPATPTTCTGCHQGGAAPDACATCHLTRPDGRLQTALAYGPLSPRGTFRDDDHRGDWLRRHALPAKADARYCETCHTPDDCARCHLSGVKPETIHPGDYILTHAPDARRNSPDCTSCHRLQSFCVDCHVRSGLGDTFGAANALNAGHLGARFHPDGFVDYLGGAPGPDHHKYAARRNLRACVGCHQESTCVRCHAVDSALPLRVSPHPPGFRAHCGPARARNERGCLKCHGSRAALDMVCDR